MCALPATALPFVDFSKDRFLAWVSGVKIYMDTNKQL